MNIIILQSPFIQLNSPYPASAYLYSFFTELKKSYPCIKSIECYDINNLIFHSIFSPEGLSVIFNYAQKNQSQIIDSLEDEDSFFNIIRFLSYKDKWLSWINPIKKMLCSNDKELMHEFVNSAHIPRGFRMEQYLQTLDRQPCVEDSAILASLAIADLSDFIRLTFDKCFSLVQYASSLVASNHDFSVIEKHLDSPILTQFLEPLLQNLFKNHDTSEPTLICISVPFAGTVTPALNMARFFKKHFSQSIRAMGGGFVNTELRSLSEKTVFSYIDFLSYDAGFGSYVQLFDFLNQENKEKQLYKLRYLQNKTLIAPLSCEDERKSTYFAIEQNFIKNTFPDYSFCDFSRYPKMVDDINPMHRIWSDGTWIKAYLAYGCYWHRCAFCDTQLNYVNNFCMQNASDLFNALYQQAEKKESFGIHFVDEAAPPVLLKEFALKNCRLPIDKNRLSFWGNIRFEKVFSRDLADFLAFGGLTAVSAGIEIALDDGMACINKGTTLADIVCACAAFKEAGILVHAYMIYGYFYETPQMLINSMEILRQFFSFGLIDSCFWHKFVLTKHSELFSQWEKGMHPTLHPTIRSSENIFADYDIPFANENLSKKYENGLLCSLSAWMQGEKLTQNVQKWFDFSIPAPTIEKNFVQGLLNTYEKRKKDWHIQRPANKNRYYWLGSNPVAIDETLHWFFMGELHSLKLSIARGSPSAQDIVSTLEQLKPSRLVANEDADKIFSSLHLLPKDKLLLLRKNGLAVL
ncbi:MAG: radical SAM protein [Treponemataceae bacterium]